MNPDIKDYLEKFDKNVVDLFLSVREEILNSSSLIEEKMWAKLPSYYVGDKFIRLILFKDHLNIECSTFID